MVDESGIKEKDLIKEWEKFSFGPTNTKIEKGAFVATLLP